MIQYLLGTVRLVGVGILLAIIPTSRICFGDDSERLERFYDIWQEQAREIETGRIKLLSLIEMFSSEESSPTRDQFNHFVQELSKLDSDELTIDSPKLEALTASLHLDPDDGNWRQFTILVDGARVRNTRAARSRGTGTPELTMDQARTGAADVCYLRDSGQASVHLGSRFHYRRPETLRWVPWRMNSYNLVRSQDDVVELVQSAEANRGETRLWVSEKTGLVSRSRSQLAKNTRFQERYQSNFAEFSGGILFPQVVAISSGTGRSLSKFEVHLVRRAEFNIPINDAEFLVPLDAGVVIADYRRGGERPRTTRIAIPAESAIAAANHPSHYREVPSPE